MTGPTGSGKSTSLTAFIRLINKPERRIITVEDPVEYEVPGVNQTQVHPEIGLTFAQSLRAVLRQDPDVIMVGEIRDRETADIAIRASLTGHLVMSTHTNDAPGALTRLVDMDIEPFLIASSVEMIIAQRLVRRLCPNCALPATYDERQITGFLNTMRLDPSEAQHGHLAKSAVGCERCRNLGFRGRIGVFEILRVTEEIHEHIVKRDSARLIRQTAVSQDMRTLMQSGWSHIKNGTTTFEEVMRFAELARARRIKHSRFEVYSPHLCPLFLKLRPITITVQAEWRVVSSTNFSPSFSGRSCPRSTIRKAGPQLGTIAPTASKIHRRRNAYLFTLWQITHTYMIKQTFGIFQSSSTFLSNAIFNFFSRSNCWPSSLY